MKEHRREKKERVFDCVAPESASPLSGGRLPQPFCADGGLNCGSMKQMVEHTTALIAAHLQEGKPLEELACGLKRLQGLLQTLMLSDSTQTLIGLVDSVSVAARVVQDLSAGQKSDMGFTSSHLPPLIRRVELEHLNYLGQLQNPEILQLLKLRELLSWNPESCARRETQDAEFWRLRRHAGLVRVCAYRCQMWHEIFETVIDDYIQAEIPPRKEVFFPPEKLRPLLAMAGDDLCAASWLGRPVGTEDPGYLRELERASVLFGRYAQRGLPGPYDLSWRTIRRELRWQCDRLKGCLQVVRAPFKGGMMHPLLVDAWDMTPKFVIKPEYPHDDEFLIEQVRFQVFNSSPQHASGVVFEPPDSIWHELEALQSEWVIDPLSQQPQTGLEKVFSAELLRSVFYTTCSRLVLSRLAGRVGGFVLSQVGRQGLLPDKEANLAALEKQGEPGGQKVGWIYLAVASKDFLRAGVEGNFDPHGWQNQVTSDVFAAEGIESAYGRVRIGHQANAAIHGHQRIGYRRLPVVVDYHLDGRGYKAQIIGAHPRGTITGRVV